MQVTTTLAPVSEAHLRMGTRYGTPRLLSTHVRQARMNLLSSAAGYAGTRLVLPAHPSASSDARTVCLQGSRSFPADSTSNFIFPFTLQQLIVLRTLALSQSLEEAAAAVAMSESNIRATLGKLEKDLDVELLQAQVTSPRSMLA